MRMQAEKLWRVGVLLTAVIGGHADASASKHPPRDYFRGVNEQERRNIHYIVDILSHKNLASIWMHQGDLNAAGDALAAMHPFRFLEVLLMDSHNRAGVLKIHERSLVWSNFYEGIRGSLQNESQRHNLTDEQIRDFAHHVHSDAAWIQVMVFHHRWKELVDGLFHFPSH